jgi:hypothetical protein
VLRRIWCEVVAIAQFNQSGSKLPCSAVRWVAHRRSTECRMSDPPDADDATASGERPQEAEPLCDLGACRRAVGRLAAGMGGDHVPEKNVFLQTELDQDAVHDGRRRLGRARAGELALRRERDPRDTCTRYPGASPTSSTEAPARSRRYAARRSRSRGAREPSAY